MHEYLYALLTFDGKLTRSRYFLYLLTLGGLIIVLQLIYIFATQQQPDAINIFLALKGGDQWIKAYLMFIFLLSSWMFLSINWRRMRDIGVNIVFRTIFFMIFICGVFGPGTKIVLFQYLWAQYLWSKSAINIFQVDLLNLLYHFTSVIWPLIIIVFCLIPSRKVKQSADS